MKNIKNTKGITLIALVVTIVVLLILAAVSINMLKGENGIIARATEAREKNKYASAKEKVDIAKMASLDSIGEVDKDKLVDELNKVGTVESENWPVIANVDGYVFSIDEDGNIESPKSYNITYALNGGTNADGNPTTYTGLEDVFLKYPTKGGSAFDGWYYEGNFSGERISKIDKTKGDVTVYAKWEEETNDDYFTWNEYTESALVTGFSDLGKQKYNDGELTKLIFPKKHKELPVTGVGNEAFKDYVNIKEVLLTDNMTQIYSNAFAGCTGIEKITVPISLKIGAVSLSNSACFEGCTGAKEIHFTKGTGKGVEYSNSYSSTTQSHYSTPWYQSSNNGVAVTFEEGITEIGNNMFYECTGLKCDVSSLPRSLTRIGEYAFYKCGGLTGDVNLPRNINSIGDYAFYNCSGIIGDINLPETLEKIGSYVFYGCIGITGKVEFSDKITSIGNSLFEGCTGLKEVIISENVTQVYSKAFAGCTGIEKITVPISLKIGAVSLSNSACFEGCTGAKEIHFTKGTGKGVEYSNSYSSTTQSHYSTPWYQSANNDIKITLAQGITSIGDNTFYQQKKATFYYDGTSEQWSEITIGTGNEALANINFLK